MNDEWSPYIESLDLTSAARTSLDEAFAVTSHICPEPPVSLFVSDYIDEGGKRVLENAWFVSPSYASECKNFLSQMDCDLVVLKSNITYFNVRLRNYDFMDASEESRLFVRFDTSDGFVSELKAARANCDQLRDVVVNHLKANLWSPGE